jgi:RND family efflux transporter MFP subunit
MRVADLRVHATAEEGPEEGGAPSGISFGKEQQWKAVGFATAFPTPGTIEESFQAIGRVVPAGGGVASVAAPIAAMVDAAGATRSPAPGERVRKGQALAVLTPALGETGSALAQARAALHEAEDEHARAKRLYEVEAVSQRRLHEAEIRLRAAREALSTFGDEVARADGRIVLRAPIDGVVASRRLVPGGHVEAGTELFRVIDPTVVWLEVNVTAADAARIGSGSRATFRVPGTEATHSVRRAVSTGSVIDSVSRTILVIYEVANPDGILKIGMSAQVAVGTGQRVSGLVIPTSAVLDEDGRPIAYVQTEGELFEKRYLTVAATGGDRTLVRAGITAGERVVTGEAYQVRLASLSTSVPAHGHAH